MSSVNDDDATTDDERRLSAALNAAAAEIVPAPGGLARIRERTSAGVPWWRRQLVLRVAAGAVATSAAVVAIAVATRSGPGDDTVVLPADSSASNESGGTRSAEPTPSAPQSTAPPTESPSTYGTAVAPPPDPSGSAPAPEPMTVPVYYVADTPDGDRLVREFHTVSTDRSAVATALDQMLATPSDPDYRTLWATTTQVVAAEVTAGTIKVELGSLAGADGEFASPELAVQQLVYTATAAASSLEGADGALPVQIRLDDTAAAELRALDLSAPITREDQLDVRQLVQITNPAEGAEATSPVTVDGEAAGFEANLVWEVRDADGAVVASDFTTTAECCTFSPFTFEVELAPGTYEIAVSDTDPSGGA
ncbi:MAG TPA: Gmad2 immunoglobulin-like domain-containing protein, partial [Jiangellaceae bacterium]